MKEYEDIVVEASEEFEKTFELGKDESLHYTAFVMDQTKNKLSALALRKIAYYTFPAGEVRNEILRVARDVYGEGK